jgi:hypothetical protein
MASSTPAASLRQLLDGRITELLNDAEGISDARAAQQAGEADERARRETADQLNQAVRRMRQAANAEEVSAALLDVAARFATGAPETAGDFGGMAIPLAEAPALAAAVESRDRVVTDTAPASVSALLAKYLEHPIDGRASVFPVASREGVVALAYAWGAVEGPPIELLAEVAGAVWSGISRPTAASLIAITPAQPQVPHSASPWESLSAEDQRLHLRAQRFARVRVAEMRLHHAAEVQTGRARRNLYGALVQPIDAARESFRKTYFDPCPSMVDYLHLELVRTLANDDPELLGENYPGVII